jgi:alpha-2-macroglobulin
MKTQWVKSTRLVRSFSCAAVLLIAFSLQFLLPPSSALAAAPSIQLFSPQGPAKNVRQVVARFSDEMVSFGDPRLDDPFEIKCPEPGKGRWADTNNWVYDFDKDIKSGTGCTFSLKKDQRTLKGEKIEGKTTFSFTTGGPEVTSVFPSADSKDIDEHQVFILSIDGEVQADSVIRNVYCYLPATKEKLGIKLLKEDEKEALLKTVRYDIDKKADNVMVQCSRPLPSNFAIDLVWGKNILSKTGIPSKDPQVFHFKTRGPFTATFHCEREKAKSDCIPILPVSIRFSAPITPQLAQRLTLKEGAKTHKPVLSREDASSIGEVIFKGPFHEKTALVITLPKGLTDDAGRTLSNAKSYPLTIKTGPYPPLAKFSSRFGIIEKSDPVLPVTVRNIEPSLKGRIRDVPIDDVTEKAKGAVSDLLSKTASATKKIMPDKGRKVITNIAANVRPVEGDIQIMEWLQKLSSVGRTRSILKSDGKAKALNMPRPLGQKAFEVMGIPFKKTGLYVVELESGILGSSLLATGKPVFVHTAALVTNLSAHLKKGNESSLVWVTTLDTARPVPGARVTIRDAKGRIHWEGDTDKNGIALINKPLVEPQIPQGNAKIDEDAYYDYSQTEALSAMESGFFAFVHTQNDMTFVHSSWDRGIEPYRFRLPEGAYHETSYVIHTVLDRTLFRAGETVHMKHIARKKTMYGLTLPDNPPTALTVEHSGSDQKYKMTLAWNKAAGFAENTWQIPKDAKLGTYFVYLGQNENREQVGEFKVQEFKVPLMKASIKALTDPLVNATEFDVDLLAEYLSGGSAKNLPVRFRALTQVHPTFFDDYEDFRFAEGPVKVGIVTNAEEEWEDYDDEGGYEADNSPRFRAGRPGQKTLKTKDVILGPGGMARTKVEDIPVSPTPVDVVTEMEFMDPSGKIITISRTFPVFPSKVLLGIDAESHTSAHDPLRFTVLACDLAGKPLPDLQIDANLYQKKFYSHRKRLIGGFYAYDHTTEIKKVGAICTGKTTKEGLLFCEVKPQLGGSLIIEASTKDDSGNVSATNKGTYVMGREDSWFDVSDSDRIDLIPDKRKYEPGETATFQVRMPMREATALVTIEREGVIESFVTTISGKEPLIQVPIKASYAPNVFVSALLVRGRTTGPAPTAFIDLGKPVFKLGITGVSVGWQAHELKVAVNADQQTYSVRGKALVKIKAQTLDGKPLPRGAEAAVSVVDDGLLELMQNRSWDLLEAMMEKRPYSVATSTAQMQVVGRRHYGLKALPFGGGGGKQITRELFDTLLLWKTTVPLNQAGEASIEVPLNDSFTSFSVVAVVTAGPDRFGTGRTHIATRQDLMLLSGLPSMVRQGDKFKAIFTLRNVTDHPITSDVAASASTLRGKIELSPVSLTIGPGEAREAVWDVFVPDEAESLKWDVSARDRDGTATDAIKITQKVAEAIPLRVYQATVTQLEKPMDMSVAKPKEASIAKGGVKVSAKARLSDDMTGVTDYMSSYPYSCMEQRISKAIALQNDAMWAAIIKMLPAYIDRDGLAKYFPTEKAGSDVLTSYIIAIAHESGRQIPADIQDQLAGGLEKFVEEKLSHSFLSSRADLTIRKLAAIAALSRIGKAKAELLDSLDIRVSLWPTSAVLDWTTILKNVKNIPNKDKKLIEAENTIRTRLNFQGTHMGFSTEKADYLWWLMVHGDINAARVVLTFLKDTPWKQDMPRMVQGLIGRQQKGRWFTTIANAWGVVALNQFSDAFEKTAITGITRAAVGSISEDIDWAKDPTGATLSFTWPKGPTTFTVSHEGKGKPWLFMTSFAALPLEKPLSTGFTVKKTYTPVEQKNPGAWTMGDVVRIRLDCVAQSDMTWVVVNDPIPAGAAIMGGALSRDSQILRTGEEQSGWAYPTFEERSFEAFRAYYAYVHKGKWSVEYTVRLNTTGTFVMPTTRVEALYAPEMFGEIPNGVFKIE